jgi:putative transcriptional regulator
MRKTILALLEVIQDTANGLYQAGVMDQGTLGEFDRLCLPPVEPLGANQANPQGRTH